MDPSHPNSESNQGQQQQFPIPTSTFPTSSQSLFDPSALYAPFPTYPLPDSTLSSFDDNDQSYHVWPRSQFPGSDFFSLALADCAFPLPQDCLADLDSLRNDDPFAYDFNPSATESQGSSPSASVSYGASPEDPGLGFGRSTRSGNSRRGSGQGQPQGLLQVESSREQRQERRRLQNREAQRAFRARKNDSLARASDKLLASLLEIKSLREQKTMWEGLARQREERVRELERELHGWRERCVCQWAVGGEELGAV